jgi:tetratricopeptide (TPR) repeat protein
VSQPAVSIILARKNSEDDLSAALNSLREQTFSHYQIVIADVAESMAAARNNAVRQAQGEYVAFADSDQFWAPAKLDRQFSKLKENQDLRWCYCDALVSATGMRSSDSARLQAGDILRPLLLKNFIPSGSVVMSRTVFEAMGGFDESAAYRLNEEWELWIRMAALYPAGLIDEPLVYLQPEISPSEEKHGSGKRVVESAVARHQDRLKDLRSESLAEICISAGNAHLHANQRDKARLYFEEALTHSPMRSDAYLSWVSSFLSSEAQRQIRDLHQLSRQLQRTEKGKAAEKITSG